MSKINDAMCLTITPNDKGFIILEYVTPCPKNTIKDWDKYIRRQRVAGKPQIMLITTADKYYNDVLKFKHGDKFLIENKWKPMVLTVYQIDGIIISSDFFNSIFFIQAKFI